MKYDQLNLIGDSVHSIEVGKDAATPQHDAQLQIVDGSLMYGKEGVWEEATYIGPERDLFEFTKHNFSVAGASGSNGPTLAALKSAYSAQAWAQDERFFTSDNGVQVFTVPATGVYEFYGLGTTFVPNDTRWPNRPRISGRMELNKGDKLRIVVGQAAIGMAFPAGSQAAGSPGATFVESLEKGLIIAVGSQGLGQLSNRIPPVHTPQASAYNVNNVTYQPTTVEGNGGKRVQLTATTGGQICYAFGGGGYLTDGEGTGGGKAFKNGARGGTWTGQIGNAGVITVEGGFGGGAAAQTGTGMGNAGNYAYGGGAGYTGASGGCGNYNASSCWAGTGGSYLHPSATSREIMLSAENMDVTTPPLRLTRIS